jgi:hypothetical protein
VFSDIVELLGLACLVAGVFVLLGLGFAFLAAGGCLLFVGQGIDDKAVARALAHRKAQAHARASWLLGLPGRRVASWRARPKAA